MRRLLFSLVIAILAIAHQVAADDQPVVVELFTSQGCSSCPPADQFLTELAKRDNVIALALHVDYWDYLGWKDQFASQAYSLRQRAYARVAQKHTVYTPQMVIQGTSHAVGNRVNVVNQIIADHSKTKAKTKVDLEVSRSGDVLIVVARVKLGSVGPSVIQLVRYEPEKMVVIRGGENAGKEIVYSNIVTYWKPLTEWNGRGVITARTTITGPQPVVILVQSKDFGPIIAAHVIR